MTTHSHHARVQMLALAIAVAALALLPTPASSAPPPPIDLADVFLVGEEGGWFCASARVTCPPNHGSRAVASELLAALRGAQHPDLHLRVAKARNACEAPDKHPKCQTAVPDPSQHPQLVRDLEELRGLGVKLGVIIGADEDGADTDARSVVDLAWQACEISRTDTRRLYDFMFLDLTKGLSARALKRVVSRIRAGKTASGKPCHGVPAANRGWRKLIVNDNHTATLRSGAWAHAKRLEVLDGKVQDRRIRRAAEGSADVLTPPDRRFLKQVAKLKDSSFAVLRLEVTSQTDRFAGLPVSQQCSLLRQWASLQHSAGYALIYPIFVHGVGQTRPYDSFRQGTFGFQRALIDRYPTDPAPAAAGGCDGGGGTPRPGTSPPASAPAPPAVPAGARSLEPTAVTCSSARLHGQVNPHGTATRFEFMIWRRGAPGQQQPAGAGSVPAGRDRVDVSRVAEGLQPDTGYSAKLIATNGGGKSVSDVVSFTTRRRC